MNYLLPLVSGKHPLALAGKLILLAAFIVSLVWTGLQTVHFVSCCRSRPADFAAHGIVAVNRTEGSQAILFSASFTF